MLNRLDWVNGYLFLDILKWALTSSRSNLGGSACSAADKTNPYTICAMPTTPQYQFSI